MQPRAPLDPALELLPRYQGHKVYRSPEVHLLHGLTFKHDLNRLTQNDETISLNKK